MVQCREDRLRKTRCLLGRTNHLGYTGRPAFVAEISGSMKHDITLSVGGTALIIAILFWLAHRRWKPMLWLLTLLALILGGTLALGRPDFRRDQCRQHGLCRDPARSGGGLCGGALPGSAGLPVASPCRKSAAPSRRAFFGRPRPPSRRFSSLNFGGLPGLAQLGSLVGIGVALSALVMIMAFLPPLFPDRMTTARRTLGSRVETASRRSASIRCAQNWFSPSPAA